MKPVFLIVLMVLLIFFPSKTSHRRRRRSAHNYTRKCYEELGCLETSKIWFHPVHRPENPEPASRHSVKTQFVFYTHDDQSKLQNSSLKGQIVPAKADFIRDSGFKCEHPTLIFIHDFTSHGWAGWIKHMIPELLKKGNWNIYSVDWEFGARPPYPQAVSNARVVAMEILFLLNLLQKRFSLDMNDVHIVGHGVGAHIAGYVGGNIQGLGKITALDPSGPYFQGMSCCVRLDYRDAMVVQVIHTDTVHTKGETGQGNPEPLGHFDFYPNLGYSQPGCEENDEFPSLLKVTEDSIQPGHTLPGCSHKRAFKYIKDALLYPDCPFLGFRCRNKDAFLNGQCTTCGENGMNCVPIHVLFKNYPKQEAGAGSKFFLKTNNTSPFCLYPYNVVLELTVPEEVNNEVEGTLSLKLQENTQVITLDFVNTWPQKFEQGRMKSFLGYHPPPKLLNVDHCEITWTTKGAGISVTSVYINFLGNYPPSNMTTKLCSCNNKDHTQISAGKPGVFVKCGMVPASEIRKSLVK